MNLREFFYLQKSDRKVVIFLLTLAAAAISIVYLLGDKNTRTIGDSENETSILGLDNPTKYGKPKENGYYELRDGKKWSSSLLIRTPPTAHNWADWDLPLPNTQHLQIQGKRRSLPIATRFRPPLWTHTQTIPRLGAVYYDRR